MSRSSPAPPPHPERRPGEQEPLVDALGGYMAQRRADPSHPAVDEPDRRRGLRLAAVAAVALLLLIVLVLIV